MSIVSKNYFKIIHNDVIHVPRSWRDSAILDINNNTASMPIRPTIDSIEIVWYATASINNLAINLDDIKPVLPFEEWEIKAGWPTNAVKISSNEYLVG